MSTVDNQIADRIGGSPGIVFDALELDGQCLFADEEPCSTCRVPRHRWPVTHKLYRENSSQCPWCIQADIDEDRRQQRRDEI